MSESELSLGDESSFHISDYSTSTTEDDARRPTTGEGHKKVRKISPIQKFKPEVVPRQASTDRHSRRVDTNSNFSLSGSSSGSPWVDDTGSSSGTSSNTTKSEIFLSIREQIRFDEARARLKASQKRPRSVPKRRIPSYDSSSSVCTGKDPSKPIDVTGANDLSFVPLRQSRQRNDEPVTPTKNRIKVDKEDIPNARIVGLLPTIVEGKENRPNDRNKKGFVRPVPPIIVPEFCSRDDDVSSLGANYSVTKAKVSHQRHHGKQYGDVEHGVNKNDNDSEIGAGWIEQRTNLELCLIFLVASSSCALFALVILIFTKN